MKIFFICAQLIQNDSRTVRIAIKHACYAVAKSFKAKYELAYRRNQLNFIITMSAKNEVQAQFRITLNLDHKSPIAQSIRAADKLSVVIE